MPPPRKTWPAVPPSPIKQRLMLRASQPIMGMSHHNNDVRSGIGCDDVSSCRDDVNGLDKGISHPHDNAENKRAYGNEIRNRARRGTY